MSSSGLPANPFSSLGRCMSLGHAPSSNSTHETHHYRSSPDEWKLTNQQEAYAQAAYEPPLPVSV